MGSIDGTRDGRGSAVEIVDPFSQWDNDGVVSEVRNGVDRTGGMQFFIENLDPAERDAVQARIREASGVIKDEISFVVEVLRELRSGNADSVDLA